LHLLVTPATPLTTTLFPYTTLFRSNHGSDGQHLLTRSVSKVQRGHPTCGSTRDGHPIRIHTVLLSMASYPSQHLGDILRSGHHCFLEFGMTQAIFAQSFGHIGGCTSTRRFVMF